MVRFDERLPGGVLCASMNTPEAVVAIQRWYPQIYLACHVRHTHARASRAAAKVN